MQVTNKECVISLADILQKNAQLKIPNFILVVKSILKLYLVCQLETNQSVWITSQLTGFYMIKVFTERCFPTDFSQMLPQY